MVVFYASANPDSPLPAGGIVAIVVVMIAVLAFWLIMVFVADRHPRTPSAGDRAAVTAPDELTEDELTEDEHVSATSNG